ncbi:glycosyltransferase [Patescibacteria group bacterium]|nr:glycosyltransferase [Patescibacteria group bacterium]
MKNNNPLVSVIMPAYNSEKYISEAIESILNQSFKDFEFIIIDDGSTDKTWEIIQEYAEKDERVVAVKNEKNLNNYACRNKGIKISKGKYIVWQDSDDISMSNRLEKQVDFMENNLEVGICGSFMQIFTDEKDLNIRKYSTEDKDLRKDIFKYSPIAQPTAIIRKECYEKVGYYDDSYDATQDLDMTFRIGNEFKLANIPEVLIRYRVHPNSVTYKKVKKQIINALRIRRKYSEGYAYNLDFTGRVVMIFTWFSQFLPVNLVYKVFEFVRGLNFNEK